MHLSVIECHCLSSLSKLTRKRVESKNCLSLLLPSKNLVGVVLAGGNRKKDDKNLGKQFLFKSGCILHADYTQGYKGKVDLL
jgi:hypothetical protein